MDIDSLQDSNTFNIYNLLNMKKQIIFLALILTGLTLHASSVSYYGVQKAGKVLAGKQKFYSPDGKFKIMFPAEPTRTEENVPTDLGDIKMVMFMYEKNPSEAFMVAYSDYPESSISGQEPYALMESSKEGVLNNFGATAENVKKYKIQNYPALSFEGRGTDFCTSYLLVLRNNRLYQIAILKAGQLPDKADVKSFILSFELTN